MPADALPLFMDNVWTTIKDCKDINLPNQKTLVANLRCTDIKNEIVALFQDRLNNLKEKASKGHYPDFGSEGNSIVSEALEKYDLNTENYDKTVVSEKRKELSSNILQTLYDAYEKQISIIRKSATSDLTSKLAEIKINPENIGNVMGKVKGVQNEVYSNFEKAVRSAVVPASEWSVDLVISEVNQQMEETVSMFREKQLAFILKQKATQIRRELEGETVKLFNNLDNDFWVVLDNFYNETLKVTEDYIKNMLSGTFYNNY